jgi:hypothetical protein
VAELLASDPRTKGLPLYVVVDPQFDAADLADYSQIQSVLTPDDLRPQKLEPIVGAIAASGRAPFVQAEAAVVGEAVDAIARVNRLATAYPVERLEPALLAALGQYGPEISGSIIAALQGFGTQASLAPLAGLVKGDADVELKVMACRAMAAVLKRTGTAAPADVVSVLKDCLAGDVPALRAAAAEALGVAGLSAQDCLMLLQTEALGG